MENDEELKTSMDKLYKESFEYYCYLDDAMGIDTSKENRDNYKYERCNCVKVKCSQDRVNGECYKDPDGKSKKLYEDILEIYNCKAKEMKLDFAIKNICIPDCNLYFKLNTNKVSKEELKDCSTDYIGPSRSTTGAKSPIVNADKDFIGQTLRICRTIGGHIFWPYHKIGSRNTINCTKGGFTFYDHIDYTLAELKNFLDGNSNSILKVDSEKTDGSALFKAFKRYHEWFEIFKENRTKTAFKTFIDFMFLDDAEDNFKYGFVDKDYNVINLITNKPFEKDKDGKINLSDESLQFSKEHYYVYARNLCEKILKRTERIKNFSIENDLSIQDTKK